MSDQIFSHLRIDQFLHYVIYPPRVPAGPLSFARLIELTRVPPRYFVDNVEAMIDLAHTAGAPILFVAPPYGASVTNPLNDALFPAELIPKIHTLYLDLLRATVSRHPGAAGLVEFLPPEFDVPLMEADGIPPTEAGYLRIAEAVSQSLLPILSGARPQPAALPPPSHGMGGDR